MRILNPISLLALVAVVLIVVVKFGFNRQIIDLHWKYESAVIKDGFPGYSGTVKIRSWIDYDESDMIQITTTDGRTMLTHSANVILLSN